MNIEYPYQSYINDSIENYPDSIPPEGFSEWICPSNIALVKYWGKKEYQVPLNPSVSFTLNNSVTKLRLEYKAAAGNQFSPPEFFFEGIKNESYEKRIHNYFETVSPFFPFF